MMRTDGAVPLQSKPRRMPPRRRIMPLFVLLFSCTCTHKNKLIDKFIPHRWHTLHIHHLSAGWLPDHTHHAILQVTI